MARNHREVARQYARQGLSMLAHAINACDDPNMPYRFADDEQIRFQEMMVEVVAIVESGRIESLELAQARRDQDFQVFLRGLRVT